MATFGERLRFLREEKGLGQKAIAGLLEVSEVSVSNYEADQRTPSPDAIIKLANFFDETSDFLLGISDLRKQDMKDIDGVMKVLASLPPEARKEVESFVRFVKGKYEH